MGNFAAYNAVAGLGGGPGGDPGLLQPAVAGAVAAGLGGGQGGHAPLEALGPGSLGHLADDPGAAVPATWDEMWELAEKAQAEGSYLFTYPTTGYFDAFLYALMYSVGGGPGEHWPSRRRSRCRWA